MYAAKETKIWKLASGILLGMRRLYQCVRGTNRGRSAEQILCKLESH